MAYSQWADLGGSYTPPSEETVVENEEENKEPTIVKKYVEESTDKSSYYAPLAGSDSWFTGADTSSSSTGDLPGTVAHSSKIVTKRFMGADDAVSSPVSGKTWDKLNSKERKSIGSRSILIDRSAVVPTKWPTAMENIYKRNEMLNDYKTLIQNTLGFPYSKKESSVTGEIRVHEYDYQIIPGDTRYGKNGPMVTLEDKLKQVRAAFGIPVHGSNKYARAMKYYMYNRFKVPDTNLLHNRSETYVFFTRPDLNILNGNRANAQTLNHTESSMVWRRYPELFKLLTDSKRCGDSDNFNMLLSNQVTSFDIRDEELDTITAGKSWHEYTVPYGESYNGRNSGEFTCNFNETSDYSVINLIKLWITYIDNVARGAWSPSYNLYGQDSVGNSHVFTKTLDYAASVYVFKCGPDGSDVLYWSKYYGVFPVSTGASALSWDNDTSIGTAPKLNIRFKYAWKKDMSPISLLEFNHNARVSGDIVSEAAFNPKYAHVSRPFVGCPFIQIYLADPELNNYGGATISNNRTSIRLMFKQINQDNSLLNDKALYRAN